MDMDHSIIIQYNFILTSKRLWSVYQTIYIGFLYWPDLQLALEESLQNTLPADNEDRRNPNKNTQEGPVK